MSEDSNENLINGSADEFEAIATAAERIAVLREQAEEAFRAIQKIHGDANKSGIKIDKVQRTFLEAAITKHLSAAYRNKARWEWGLAVCYFILFVSSLIAMGVVAFLALKGIDLPLPLSLEDIKLMTQRVVRFLPVYIPLLWFVCFTGQRLGISRRMAESYAHKALIGNTYVALAEAATQIKEDCDDPEMFKRLREGMLSTVYNVFGRSPLDDLKGIRDSTPLNEITDAVEKILRAVPRSHSAFDK